MASVAPTGDLSFVKRDDSASNSDNYSLNRAAALGTPYLLETNIKLLPDDNLPNCLAAVDMSGNEERRAKAMGENAVLHYQEHPLSCALDGNIETTFLSPYSESKGRPYLHRFLNSSHRCKTRRLHSHRRVVNVRIQQFHCRDGFPGGSKQRANPP